MKERFTDLDFLKAIDALGIGADAANIVAFVGCSKPTCHKRLAHLVSTDLLSYFHPVEAGPDFATHPGVWRLTSLGFSRLYYELHTKR